MKGKRKVKTERTRKRRERAKQKERKERQRAIKKGKGQSLSVVGRYCLNIFEQMVITKVSPGESLIFRFLHL